MSGWLADRQGNSTPLNLLVFIDGSFVAATQTKGERDDVTKVLRLSAGAEKNVVFSLNFNCRPVLNPFLWASAKETNIFPFHHKNVLDQNEPAVRPSAFRPATAC